MSTSKKTKQVTEVAKKKYKFSLTHMNETQTIETDDLLEAFNQLKPEWLRTTIHIKIEKGDDVVERFIFITKARMLLNNPFALEGFISTITI